MSNVQEAYSSWSQQYDTNVNQTRDLEAMALRKTLADTKASAILEIGCGTGKNTLFLGSLCSHLLAVDLTEAMLEKAKEKVTDSKVQFQQADITLPWHFTNKQFDVITFSLVLEHIENLDFVFEQAKQKLTSGGRIYVGELHPFKQYSGSKARFDTEEGRTIVDCFTHHISDFVAAAEKQNLKVVALQEFFDSDDRSTIPRLLVLMFE